MSWADSSNRNKRRACELAALLGLVGAVTDVTGLGASTAMAQAEIYRSADAVPASWRDFALHLQRQFQERLAADDKTTGKLTQAMTRAGTSPATVTVQVWVSPAGQVERLAFDDLDGETSTALRSVLGGRDVGLPPPDMLQPLHLRLSLHPKSEQRAQ
jgi:hypothetical protein